MGLPSPRTLQSQGHLGKRRDTDVLTEQDREKKKGGKERRREKENQRQKKGGQCEIFPAIDLLARDMHRFLYVEDKCL